MKKIIGITLLMGLSIIGFTQNFGEIHGKIIDEFGDPMPGALVSTETNSGTISDVTDKNGNFKIKPLLPGTYSIDISVLSYKDQKNTGIIVDPNKNKRLGSIQLTPESVDVGGDAIVYGMVDKLIDPEETSLITKRYSEIKQSPLAKTPLKFIATMTPGVKEIDGELYFRGSRAGAVQYHIDGVKMTTNASRIPSSAIGSISVYTGGVPAKYGDTTGGVVVIETRSFMDLYNKKKYSN